MKKFSYEKLMIEMQTRVLKSATDKRPGKRILADADEDNIYFCVGGFRLYKIPRQFCFLDCAKFDHAAFGEIYRKTANLPEADYMKPAGIVLNKEGDKLVKFTGTDDRDRPRRVYIQEKFINEYGGIEHVYVVQERGNRRGPCIVATNYLDARLGLVMPVAFNEDC